MRTGPEAVVVGAGIGGLTAAVALRRIGWSVTVLERAPIIAEVGAGLTLWPNAVRALATLDLAAAVEARAVRTVSRGNLRTPKGRWLRRSHPDDVGVLAIHRAELHDVLRQALPAASLHTDAEVIEVRPEGTVVWRSGAEKHELTADLVVAADGVNSVARRSLWSVEPVFQHRAVWRGVSPSGSVWPVQEGLTLGRGQQVGLIPLPDERVYWFVMVNEERRNTVYVDEQAEVLRLVDGWHHPIPALVRATPPDHVLHNDIVDLDPLPTYVKDHVVLLGDAAHAMSPDLGQGACQAIEDAVVLAGALADAEDGGVGLRRYDLARRGRVQPMAAAARASMVRSSSTSFPAYVGVCLAARLVPAGVWRKATSQWADWWPEEKNKQA